MKSGKEAAVFDVCQGRSNFVEWKIYFVQGLELLFLGIGTYFDIKDRELPIPFLTFFAVIGMICNLFWRYQSTANAVIGICIGGIFLLAGWITKEAIGYGDGIGLVILGLFGGGKGMIPIVITGFLLAGIYGLWRIIGYGQSGSDTMPFYPFLLLALIGVILL